MLLTCMIPGTDGYKSYLGTSIVKLWTSIRSRKTRYIVWSFTDGTLRKNLEEENKLQKISRISQPKTPFSFVGAAIPQERGKSLLDHITFESTNLTWSWKRLD